MNLNPLSQRCGLLDYQIGNVKSWVWPTSDKITFGIIVKDWVETIRPFLGETFGSTGLQTSTVLQGGGNCGVYPLLYTEFFKTVVTFEPDPLSFFCLSHNCQVPGIVKINAAISDGPGSIIMREVEPSNRGMNKAVSINPNSKSTEEVIPAMAIDSLEFRDLKLMQLDLEGNEIKAMDGAMKTISKHKPVIILECGNDRDEENIEYHNEVVRKMNDIGYKKTKQLNRLDVVFLPNQ